jgi:hypothetical protein
MERLTLLGSPTSSTAATAVRSCSVQAQAVGFRFHVGEAQVSGYVLLASGRQPYRPRPSRSTTVRGSCSVGWRRPAPQPPHEVTAAAAQALHPVTGPRGVGGFPFGPLAGAARSRLAGGRAPDRAARPRWPCLRSQGGPKGQAGEACLAPPFGYGHKWAVEHQLAQPRLRPRPACLSCPTVLRTYVHLPYRSWGPGKRMTRPTLGRSPRRWSGAPSCSASTSPPSRGQRPTSSLTSGSTAARSGASCNWSGAFVPRHTGACGAATSAVDGARPTTNRSPGWRSAAQSAWKVHPRG